MADSPGGWELNPTFLQPLFTPESSSQSEESQQLTLIMIMIIIIIKIIIIINIVYPHSLRRVKMLIISIVLMIMYNIIITMYNSTSCLLS